MKIALVKTGGPIRCDESKPKTPTGDEDVLPLWRRLLAEGIDVTWFGRTIDGHKAPGPYIEPPLKGVDDLTSMDEMRERLDPAIDRLGHVDAVIDMSGMPATWSNPDNPVGSAVQASAIRYSLPGLYLVEKTRAPRILIVTDPKCYKRDGEMATCWPSTTPVAVLSQERTVIPKNIQGKNYSIHTVNSGCEFWLTWEWERIANDPTFDCMIMGHSHLQSSRIPDGREEVYDEWFSKMPPSLEIYGKGWEGYDHWHGTLPTLYDLRDRLACARWGPMIAQKPGFNSTKPRIYAMSGAMPAMYSGPRFTYDPEGRILPIDHPARLNGPLGDWDYVDAVEEVLEKTTPDFSLLWDLLSDLDSLPQVSKYGGYVCGHS